MNGEELIIRRERLQYETNKLSSSLIYIAILFNAFFFISIYRTLQSTSLSYYYNYMIGVSIIYNLLFMLTAFLSSEGVKNYKMSFAIVIIVLGIFQLSRIFIIPLEAFRTELTFAIAGGGSYQATAMRTPQFLRVSIYLICSSIACISAGITGILKSIALKDSLAHSKEKKA